MSTSHYEVTVLGGGAPGEPGAGAPAEGGLRVVVVGRGLSIAGRAGIGLVAV